MPNGSPLAQRSALAAAGLLALALLAPLAAAHLELPALFPASGARVAEPPSEVWVRFLEPIDEPQAGLEVLDADLRPVPLAAQAVDRAGITATFGAPLADGGYLVKWYASSPSDGHDAYGSWTFTVGNGPAMAAPAASSASDALASWATAAAKAVAFAGLAMLCGGLALAAWVLRDPRPVRGLLWAGAWLQAAGLLAYLALQGGADPLSYALSSRFGQGLALRLALAAGALGWLAAARRVESPPAWPGLALAGASLLAFGAFSHTASKAPVPWAGALLDAVHLAAVLSWTGGLAGMLLLLRPRAAGLAGLLEAAHRFSAMAAACVGVMALTGLAMVATIAGPAPARWPAAFEGQYGLLLAAKVALAVAMVALGGLNRFVLLPRLARAPSPGAAGAGQDAGAEAGPDAGAGKEAGRRAFRANVAREAAMGVAVLLLAAALTGLAPGAAASGHEAMAARIEAACTGDDDLLHCYADALKIVQAGQGTEAAFDVLDALIANDVTVGERAHYVAHQLGDNAFYVLRDVRAAIEQCSFRASQGCLDGATEAYLISLSEITPETLRGICRVGGVYWNFTCYHGVGHGLLMALGYTLPGALALCDTLPPQHQNYCYEGAMMENAMSYRGELMQHTSSLAKGRSNATWTRPSDPAFPCNALEDRHQKACWLYQQGIIRYLNGEDAARTLATCDTSVHRAICAHGFGNDMAQKFYKDADGAVTACGEAPSVVTQRGCIDGYMSWVLMDALRISEGVKLCRDIAAPFKSDCYFALGLNARWQTDDDGIRNVCERVAQGHRLTCLQGAGLI